MILEISEFSIVIAAKNYDPNLLNLGFIQYSGIVPNSWKVKGKPIATNHASQIVFDNGVHIQAQPNRLMFVEGLKDKEHHQIKIGALANRYINVLHNIDYQGAGINFRGHINLLDGNTESNNYLVDKLIVPGNWQNFASSPVKAGLNLMFPLEQDKRLNLSINEGGLERPKSERIPIVLFSSNFDYQLNNISSEGKLERLENIISNWHEDLEIYQNVVQKIIEEPLEISLRKTQEQEKELQPVLAV